MKKLIFLLLYISTIAFPIGWNSYITTSLNVSGATVRLFSNSLGNNLVVLSSSGALTYYIMTSDGTVGTGVPIETSGVTNPCLTGDGLTTYVVYKKDNVIKMRYTTDGAYFSSSSYDINCNGSSLDATFTTKLLVTFVYNSYPMFSQFNSGAWSSPGYISSTETAYSTRLQPLYHGTTNEIYVVYQNGDNCKSKKYDVASGTWESSSHNLYTNFSYATPVGFGVDDNYIYNYYYRYESGYYNTYLNVIPKSTYDIGTPQARMHNQINYIHTTNTADNVVHTVYKWLRYAGQDLDEEYFSITDGLEHEYFNNGTRYMETIYENTDYGDFPIVDISSTYNDVFVIWKDNNSNYLRYKQFNTYPSAPQNLSLSENVNNHPVLSWTRNSDADIHKYKIWRSYGGWSLIDSTSNLTYTDPSISINHSQEAGTDVYYYIYAEDVSWNLSQNHSNSVSCNIPENNNEKRLFKFDSNPKEYKLYPNYPNPFNPTTSISYQLPQPGLVQLKVYSLLGKEIATLVNKLQPPGQYSVDFNASELSSGVYIYSLKVNGYIQNQKMTLMK